MSSDIELWGNASCVLGLAILLSTLSYAHWLARQRRMRLRTILGTVFHPRAWVLGVVLVTVGLFLSAGSPVEAIGWALFTLLYTVFVLQGWRNR